jgi:hypothetical protein
MFESSENTPLIGAQSCMLFINYFLVIKEQLEEILFLTKLDLSGRGHLDSARKARYSLDLSEEKESSMRGLYHMVAFLFAR